MARLKQAKEEAETEVAEHKTSTEHGFQRKLEEVIFIKRNLFLRYMCFFYSSCYWWENFTAGKKTDQWRFRCKREEARAGDWCQDRAVEERSFQDFQRCCGHASETCHHCEELRYITTKPSIAKWCQVLFMSGFVRSILSSVFVGLRIELLLLVSLSEEVHYFCVCNKS